MASSRINEHMEACRKQRVMDKKAYYEKYVGEQMYPGLDNYPQCHPTNDPERSYYLTQERNSYGEHSRVSNAYPKIQQKLSYDINRQQHKDPEGVEYVVYSAKLPNRLTSINYKQQW